MSVSFRLFSLRSGRGGTIDGFWGRVSDERDAWSALGINDLLARKIAALLPAARRARAQWSGAGDGRLPDAVPLLAPYLDRRAQGRWPVEQMQLEPRVDTAGRIVLGDAAAHAYDAVAAGPLLHRQAGLPPVESGDLLLFEDRRVLTAAGAPAALAPVIAAHGLPFSVPDWDGRVEATWTLALDPPAAACWLHLPGKREAAFMAHFKGVAASLQRALRCWAPYHYFDTPGAFDHAEQAAAYLVYGVLRPFTSHLKTQLTFHVLEPKRILRSLRRVPKPLTEALNLVQQRLAATGGARSAPFTPAQAAEITQSMRRIPRLFGALLAQEAFLVEELIQFAHAIRDEVAQPSGPPARVVDLGGQLLHVVRCRLGRSYGGVAHRALAPLILLAATDGLASVQGHAAPIRLRVTLRNLDTGEEVSHCGPFSYAKSAALPPLLSYGRTTTPRPARDRPPSPAAARNPGREAATGGRGSQKRRPAVRRAA